MHGNGRAGVVDRFGLLDCGLDSLHADIACQHRHREEQGPPPRPPVHGAQALRVLAVLARVRACNHERRAGPCAADWILHGPLRPQRHVPCFLHIPRFSRLRLHALLFHLRLFPGVLVSDTLPLHLAPDACICPPCVRIRTRVCVSCAVIHMGLADAQGGGGCGVDDAGGIQLHLHNLAASRRSGPPVLGAVGAIARCHVVCRGRHVAFRRYLAQLQRWSTPACQDCCRHVVRHGALLAPGYAPGACPRAWPF